VTSPTTPSSAVPPPEVRERLGVQAARAYLDKVAAGNPAQAKTLVGMGISAEAEDACSHEHGCPIPGLSVLTVRLRHPTDPWKDATFHIPVLPDCWYPCCLGAVVASVLSAHLRHLARECREQCRGFEEDAR